MLGDTDREALGLVGRTVFVLTIVYLIMNRVVPDLMVLPVGFSLRPYEIVMVLILGTWLLWMITEPHHFPTGLVGAVGLGLITILTLAPFLNAIGLTQYQANGAERGLFRMFLLVGLFMAAYHLGSRIRYAKKLLAWVIGVTVFQALLGVWEFVTKQPLTFMFELSRAFGLIFDPNAIRSERVNVFVRLSGELRAATTAPHPIVFSAGIALAVLIVAAWLVYAENPRARRWLVASGAALVVALPVANSRTPFVMLGIAAIPLVMLMVRDIPRLVPLGLIALLGLGVAFAVSPETPRLLLDSVSRAEQDQNTQIRLERFERLPELMADRPILGAGYLTHDPGIQIFDNAYNLGLIEFGILGLVFTLWWFLSALVRSWTATRLARPNEKILPISGALTVIALLAASAVFDAWTFDQFFPTSLIVLGAALGTSDMILRRERVERASRRTHESQGPSPLEP